MITLNDYLKAVNYRITEGCEFVWDCFGENAYSYEFWNRSNGAGGASVNVVFDMETQEVYELQAWHKDSETTYRWIHPDYIEAVKNECEKRSIEFKSAGEGREFTDIEMPRDILEKSTAIAEGKPFDRRIMVEINLTDEEELQLMRMAHDRDMTLNELVGVVLEEQIRRIKCTENKYTTSCEPNGQSNNQ